MDTVDWDAPATLHARDDAGSDMHFHFRTVRQGTLGALVREVAGLPSAERARVVIDVAGGSTLSVGEILSLAQRKDLP